MLQNWRRQSLWAANQYLSLIIIDDLSWQFLSILDQNCRDLADMYLKAAKENKVEGFRKKSTTEA
jgi:hypothetical protein